MSYLLIKGMDMPKSCGDCPFLYDHDACYLSGMWNDMRFMLLCFNGHTDEYKRGEFPFKEKRVDWCPLVEVPTHGRLIDADVLYKDTAEWEAQALDLVERHIHDEDTGEWRKWSTVLTERSAFKYDIADAPTVIEASEDGE